jgi:hypothetical protein
MKFVGRKITEALLLLLGAAALSCSNTWQAPDGGLPAPTPSATDLIGIGLTPNSPKVTAGEPIQFLATGFYADRSTVDVTDVVSWVTSDAGVVEISGGLDTEGIGTTFGAGQAIVSAALDGLESNAARVTVTAADVEGLIIRPGSVSVHSGSEVTVSAEASFSDGSHGDVSGTVRWITADGAVVLVDPGGRITGNAVGTSTIRAVYEVGAEPVEATATVHVLEPGAYIGNPDLRVVGLSTVAGNGELIYTVEVKNSGDAPASGFWVAAWLNRTGAPPPAPTEGDASEFVAALEPDQTTEIALRIPGITDGNYSSWVVVDSLGGLDEGGLGENNNVWGPEAVVVAGGGGAVGPDLSITYLQAYVQAEQNRTLYLIDVTNNGDETAAAFDVGVFSDLAFPPVVGAPPDELASVDPLAPGATIPLSVVIRSVPSGFWQSYVLVDTDGEVTEPNEGNNLGAFSVFP